MLLYLIRKLFNSFVYEISLIVIGISYMYKNIHILYI